MLKLQKDVFLQISFVPLLLITFLTLHAKSAHAATNYFPDCTDRITVPADYASKFKSAVLALDGTVVTNQWKIVVAMETINPSKLMITGTPYVQQQNMKLQNTALQTEVQFIFTSANANLYRMYIDPHTTPVTYGSVSKFVAADNYTRTYTIYCGFANTHVDVITTSSTSTPTSRPAVKQDVDLGFLDPVVVAAAGGGGGTTSGMSQADFEASLVKVIGVSLTVLIMFKIITFIKGRVRL